MSNTDDDLCPSCFGTGHYVVMRDVQPYRKIEPPPECAACKGTGRKPPLGSPPVEGG